jgi:hypothetical protein
VVLDPDVLGETEGANVNKVFIELIFKIFYRRERRLKICNEIVVSFKLDIHEKDILGSLVQDMILK